MALYLSKLNVNGQEYQIKDANAATAIELASKVGYGYYNSETSEIVFYDKEDTNSRTELFSIDATGFIKDGMVSNVAISEGNLVITFNTAAGKEPISIALTDIFNPANYYDKTAMDGKLADYPTINTMNTALGQKANVTDVYTQTEINNKLAAKANSADLAKVAKSGSYNDLTDKPVIPEGAVVDAALSDTSENPVQNKVVKAAIDEAKAYYIDFGVLTTQGITDAVWDGMVAAINAHRPIYAGLDNRYYTAECLYQDGSNIIKMTASDELDHFFYRFTKRGTNDYTMTYEVRPYVTEVEKHNWNAKQDAISDLSTIRSGAALGATAYQKPSTGIPASDIADGVIPTQTRVSVTGETLFITTAE